MRVRKNARGRGAVARAGWIVGALLAAVLPAWAGEPLAGPPAAKAGDAAMDAATDAAAAGPDIVAPPDAIDAVVWPVDPADYPDFLMDPPPSVPVVHLDATAIDSVGTSISDRNVALLDRIDEAYRAGHYGEPGSDDARRDALAAFIYRAHTAFDFFLELAMQHEVIYSTSEPDLIAAFTKRFRNPGLYPIVNLKDARTGFGRFCLEFEVDDPKKREIEVSGDEMRGWTEELDVDGRRFRAVNIDMKTMSHDRVHVIYERFSCGDVRVERVDQKGQPVDVVTMENVTGQYIRKWGLHRPTAVILWKSASDGIDPPPAGGRFLSSAVYFPGLKLDLPWFLPSIGFEDIRRFDFPEPLLTLDAVRAVRERDLDWIEIRKDMRFADWEGDGTVPDWVEERFPDR